MLFASLHCAIAITAFVACPTLELLIPEPRTLMNGKVRVAIIGLGFGAEFIPIYQAHPDAEMAAICRRNQAELDECGDRFGIRSPSATPITTSC